MAAIVLFALVAALVVGVLTLAGQNVRRYRRWRDRMPFQVLGDWDALVAQSSGDKQSTGVSVAIDALRAYQR